MVNDSTIRFFDQVAPEWEGMQQRMYSTRVRDVILGRAGVQPGDTVVDLGAGAGFLTLELLARGVHVTAADSSPAMLRELLRRAPSRGRLTPYEVTSERLGLEAGAYDAVVANMYLHHVEDPAGAIAEAARLLRPGGRLVFGDLTAHSFTSLHEEHHDRWLGFTPEDLKAWMAAAGLQEVIVETTAEGCSTCASDGGTIAIPVLVASGRRPD